MLKLCAQTVVKQTLIVHSTPKKKFFAPIRQIHASKAKLLNRSTVDFDEKIPNVKTNNEFVWLKLYHFEEIGYLAIITKLKIYPALTTLIGTPLVHAVKMCGFYPELSSLQFGVMGITATLIFALYSALLRNTIGIIYSCPKNENIRIAYIDFWGVRHHIDTSVEDIVVMRKKLMPYHLVKMKGNQMSLKLPNRNGNIYDSSFYSKIFGDSKL